MSVTPSIKCRAVILSASVILASCAAPSPYSTATAVERYRKLDCDKLKEYGAYYKTEIAKATVDEYKVFLQTQSLALNQLLFEKNCFAQAGGAASGSTAAAPRPRMGIQVAPVPASLAQALGLNSTGGALIVDVTKGLPAEKAGIEKMDVVLGMDGQKLATPDEVLAAIKQLGVGAKPKVQIWRNRSVKDYVVDLSAESQNGAPLAADQMMEAAAGDFDAGRYFDALKKYQKVVKQNPNDALAWYFIGQSLEKMHDAAGAKTAYKRAIEIQPQGQIADYARQMLANLSPSVTASGKGAQKKK